MRKYDSAGRLLSEKTHGSELFCNYDDDEGVVEKIWPDGRTEKYSHDLNGVLTSIQETVSGSLGAGGGPSLIVSLKPSGSNYFGQASYQGGLNVAYMYDERKRMVELSISSPEGIDEKIKYRYDVGNRMRVEGILGQDAKITYFEFDNKHRISNARDGFDAVISDGALTQADHDQAISAIMNASLGAAHEEVFAYDPSDARAKYAQTGGIGKNYTYIKGHRMQSDGTNSYSYFTEGTLQNDGQFTYRTDALGRIVTVKSGSTDLYNIDYDALGRPGTVKETRKTCEVI